MAGHRVRMPDRVFVDSDVVISALLSETGAAHLLLSDKRLAVELFISTLSRTELDKVCRRLHISATRLDSMIAEFLQVTDLQNVTVEKFNRMVLDAGDAHIIAGAAASRCRFLISYNLKHYRINAIRTELDIVVMTPANFLQFVRSK